MVVALMCILIPLVTILIIYNFYSISVIRQQTAQSNKNTLVLYTEDLDNKLANIDAFMLEIVANNANFRILRNENSGLKVYSASYNIVTRFTEGLNFNQNADLFFVYSTINHIKRMVYKGTSSISYTFDEKLALEAHIKDIVESDENYVRRKWFTIKVDEKYYLLRILGKEGTFVGAVVDLSHITIPVSKMAIKENYLVLYSNMEGTPLINSDFVKENNINLQPENDTYKLSGAPNRYMVLSEKLKSGEVNMVVLIPDTSILKRLDIIQLILLIISLLTVLIIPMSVLLLRKSVLLPLNHLITTIKEIKSGNWDTRMDVHYVSDEFKQVNDTFNSMISEIKHLKIKAYEEEIEKQKAQLQHLQFQIKPHFFLSSLKNLYGMAERKQFTAIQDIILGLSNHFRYMFKDNSTLVLLKEELNYVKNYIQIQQLYMPVPPECRIDVDERLMELKIPPLSIQTFVENSFKHGIQHETTLKISIKAVVLRREEGDLADITVMDNGKGFTKEMLDILNFKHEALFSKGHVGIRNVIQRFKLIYGETAQVFFSNSQQEGAVSEMIIPIIDEFVTKGKEAN